MTFEKYLCKKNFFYKFVEKMVVVDPLDRPIIGTDEDEQNQAISVKDLIQRIN